MKVGRKPVGVTMTCKICGRSRPIRPSFSDMKYCTRNCMLEDPEWRQSVGQRKKIMTHFRTLINSLVPSSLADSFKERVANEQKEYPGAMEDILIETWVEFINDGEFAHSLRTLADNIHEAIPKSDRGRGACVMLRELANQFEEMTDFVFHEDHPREATGGLR